ncbi:MAG: LCCL domain-containing protein [Planctomycetota bacterium]
MRPRFVWVGLLIICGISVGHSKEYPGVPGLPGALAGPASPAPLVICEPLPKDALNLVAGFDRESAAIRDKAEQDIQIKRRSLIVALQALQDSYTRDARLDEAVAIRDVLRQLRIADLKALPDPGTLSNFVNRIGESFYFEVVGSSANSAWGTEVYTYDSNLATAAVHSGILRNGQRGIVKVTMLQSAEAHHGTTQNGVTTSNWGPYSASFTVERPKPDDVPPLMSKPAATVR